MRGAQAMGCALVDLEGSVLHQLGRKQGRVGRGRGRLRHRLWNVRQGWRSSAQAFDVALLAAHFLRTSAKRLKVNLPTLTRGHVEQLQAPRTHRFQSLPKGV